MNASYDPVFLNNSPSQICDQILYLVKNSNLNFELHETPFSLNLKLKKSFAQHWKKTDNSTPTNSSSPVPQKFNNHPVGDSGHIAENFGRQTQNSNLFSFHVPQQYQSHVPQHQYQPLVPKHQHHPQDPQDLLAEAQHQLHALKPHVEQLISFLQQPLRAQ